MPTPGATKRVKVRKQKLISLNPVLLAVSQASLRELNSLLDSKEYIHATEGRDARQAYAAQVKAQSHTSPLIKAPSDKVSSASVKYPRPNAQPTKSRVKGVSIHRPFVYGSIAKTFDTITRPAGVNADHTHQWSIFVKGIDGEDISYWLKKVQFKLHETYTNNLRSIESAPFEVTETGWGEFEVQIKLYFVPEANEKPAILWHQLKLHPYGPDAEAQRERKDDIVSQSYEEVVFNEPFEPFYDILTSGPPPPPGARGKAKGSKQASLPVRKVGGGHRTAQLPFQDTPGNPYSQKTEGEELDRLKEAIKTVEVIAKEEQAKMLAKEKELAQLKKEMEPPKKK